MRVVFVLSGLVPGVEEWLAESSDHFFIKYSFPALEVRSWRDKSVVPRQDLTVCGECCQKMIDHGNEMREFRSKVQPLSTLDLFAGVGAFSRGMAEGSGCLKVTHAIEISPSAARTLKWVFHL